MISNINQGQDRMLQQFESQGSKAFMKQQPSTFDAEFHGTLICKILRMISRDVDLGEAFAQRFPHVAGELVRTII